MPKPSCYLLCGILIVIGIQQHLTGIHQYASLIILVAILRKPKMPSMGLVLVILALGLCIVSSGLGLIYLQSSAKATSSILYLLLVKVHVANLYLLLLSLVVSLSGQLKYKYQRLAATSS